MPTDAHSETILTRLLILLKLTHLGPVSPNFDRRLKLTGQADLKKIWSFAFFQHLSDSQFDINLTGRQRSVK